MAKILVVDDEIDILDFIAYNLSKEGHEVIIGKNGNEAIELAKKHLPNLIILDIMMPEKSGIEACESLRKMPELKNCFIAFLTALDDEQSELKGFEVGADEYIAKPIKPRLLISRVNALLRRSPENGNSSKVEFGDIVIDKEQYIVFLKGKPVDLARKEFELLCLLASKPGRVFYRNEILSRVWGDDVYVGDRTIDVHIRKIRSKLGDEVVKTIKGVGYKFEYVN